MADTLDIPNACDRDSKLNALQERLDAAVKRRSNGTCSECSEANPTWASILRPPFEGAKMMVVLCCFQCQSYHFQLGKDVCIIKSPKMAADWTEEEVQALEENGNHAVNDIYQGKCKDMNEGELKELRLRKEEDPKGFILDKYKTRLYFSKNIYNHVVNRHARHKKRAKGIRKSSSASISPTPPSFRQRKLPPRSSSARDVNDSDILQRGLSPSRPRLERTSSRPRLERTSSRPRLEKTSSRPRLERTSSGKEDCMGRRRDGLKKSSSHRSVPKRTISKTDVTTRDGIDHSIHSARSIASSSNGSDLSPSSDHSISSKFGNPHKSQPKGNLQRTPFNRDVEKRANGLNRSLSGRHSNTSSPQESQDKSCSDVFDTPKDDEIDKTSVHSVKPKELSGHKLKRKATTSCLQKEECSAGGHDESGRTEESCSTDEDIPNTSERQASRLAPGRSCSDRSLTGRATADATSRHGGRRGSLGGEGRAVGRDQRRSVERQSSRRRGSAVGGSYGGKQGRRGSLGNPVVDENNPILGLCPVNNNVMDKIVARREAGALRDRACHRNSCGGAASAVRRDSCGGTSPRPEGGNRRRSSMSCLSSLCDQPQQQHLPSREDLLLPSREDLGYGIEISQVESSPEKEKKSKSWKKKLVNLVGSSKPTTQEKKNQSPESATAA